MEFLAFIPMVLVIVVFFVLLAKKNKKQGDVQEDIFILKISANLFLSDRIAAGKYDWVNDNITEKNFPDKTEEDYEVKCKLFYFDRSISSKSAISEMEKKGFRPANILELLKLSEDKPELQKKFPISALGSICEDANSNLYFPYLYYLNNPMLPRQYKLDLYWHVHLWDRGYRFLGVRK